MGLTSLIRVNLKSIKPIKPIEAPIDIGSGCFGDYLEIPGQMAGDKSSMGSGTQRCREDSNKSHRSSSIDASNKIQTTSTPLVTNAENDSQPGSEDATNSIESSLGDFGDRKPVEWNLDDFPATAIQEFAVGTPSIQFMGLTKQHTYVQPVRQPKGSPKKKILSNRDLVSNEVANRQWYITGLESRIQRHEAKLNMVQNLK